MASIYSLVRFKKINISLIFICLLLVVQSISYGQQSEKARFRLYQLESRYPRLETYEVPANINAFRKLKGFTLENLNKQYLENCKEINIKPFQFDKESEIRREQSKMLGIWMGFYLYPGYKEATINLFRSIEKELDKNPEVLNEFHSLFKDGEAYITNIWDFVQKNLSSRGEEIELEKIAQFIASTKSYNELYGNAKFLRKEELSHPAFLFYVLDYFKYNGRKYYDPIIDDLKYTRPSILNRLELIHSAYQKGISWLQKASLFFLEEKWFFNNKTQQYLSLKDVIASFWEPVLGNIPPLKPEIIRWGRPEAFPIGSVPYLEYPQLLQPLNKEAERFLKDNSPAKICDLLETIREIEFYEREDSLPEGVIIKPLYAFIPSLRMKELAIEKSTCSYDLSCPLTMIISNMPHEVAHYLHFRMRSEWKKGYSGDQVIYYRFIDRYIDEGIAELCQIKSIEPVFKKYPLLYHENLLKHYINGHMSPGNHHTWGLLWMQTLYEILARDFNKIFFLATEPAISLAELMLSPEIQTEEVVKISKDTKPIAFQRQKRRRDRPHTIVFPSCIIELEGESLKIISYEQIRLE